ncbi:MAG TPA: glutamate-1-semialdehyde 2,1-aminomutase [Nitrososphaerales archaeon]
MSGHGKTHISSKRLYVRAKKRIPAGVNSPVRAYKPYPFFTSKAKGSKLTDVDGNELIDYCMSYGPLILGHANEDVEIAVRNQLPRGTMYGTPTEQEVDFAELISKLVPCAKMLRVVNSGTEATMHAIRVARGATSRDKIVKFEGCYHGAHDSVLVRAGSGASTFGSPDSLGIPKDTAKNTIVLPYNDIEAFEDLIRREDTNIAAVILEPVVGNSGLILPRRGYLQALRKATRKSGILLIFDEVITGFRVALGGAQEYYGVQPDMVTLGKIIGGGFPIGAYGGRKDLMEMVSPLGGVYQAGTLSGNPISVTAGLTVLRILAEKKNEIYGSLERKGVLMSKGLRDVAADANIKSQVNSIASMFQIFFTEKPVWSYSDAKHSDTSMFTRYHRELVERGVFIPPSQFETCFISTAHTTEDLEKTLEIMGEALKASRRG